MKAAAKGELSRKTFRMLELHRRQRLDGLGRVFGTVTCDVSDELAVDGRHREAPQIETSARKACSKVVGQARPVRTANAQEHHVIRPVAMDFLKGARLGRSGDWGDVEFTPTGAVR